MTIYGIVRCSAEFYYVALISPDTIDQYKKDAIVSLELNDKPVPVLQYEDLPELIDTWNPYSGEMSFLEMGGFDKYGNFVNEIDTETSRAVPISKKCIYEKGKLKKVMYEKI